MHLLVHTQGDAELEIWATNRHVEPYEKLVGKKVEVRLAPADAGARPTLVALPPVDGVKRAKRA
jgi:hypothetical protein